MQLFIIFYKTFSEQIIIPTFHISFKVYGKASSKHKLLYNLLILYCVKFPLVKTVATLNLFDINSKYCTVALFINVNVQKSFDAEFMSLHKLKFLPIIPVCVINISRLLVPKYRTYKQFIPTSDASFFKMLY
jgi:hypothetical protein